MAGLDLGICATRGKEGGRPWRSGEMEGSWFGGGGIGAQKCDEGAVDCFH